MNASFHIRGLGPARWLYGHLGRGGSGPRGRVGFRSRVTGCIGGSGDDDPGPRGGQYHGCPPYRLARVSA